MPFSDYKVALVTGASAGMGKRLSNAFVRKALRSMRSRVAMNSLPPWRTELAAFPTPSTSAIYRR